MRKQAQHLLSLLFLFSLIPSVVYAAIPYEASNVIGQTDVNGAINYTKVKPNNTNREYQFGYRPQIALDETHHRLFVIDNGVGSGEDGNRVLVYNLDSSNNPIDQIPDYVLGQPDFSTYSSRPTSASTLYFALGIAYDSANDRLFVSNQNRVSVFDVSTITNNEDAVYVLGQSDFTSKTGGTTQNTFNGASLAGGPRGLAFDSGTNYLYVADTNNHRVLIFDLTTISNGENAVNVLGQPDFTSNTSFATQNGMYQPSGVAIDPTGDKLFVVETGNARVTVFDISTINNGENAINVLGQTNFTNTGNATTQSRFWSPMTVAFDDTNDRLFIGDESNLRVMVFDVSTITNGENATNILGQANFTSQANTQPPTASSLDRPTSIAFDNTNNKLLVGQTEFFALAYGRISIFDTSTISNNENAVGIIGQFRSDSSTCFDSVRGCAQPSGVDRPSDSIVDETNHRLFVTDSGNNRILVYNLDTNNSLLDNTADNVLGQPDFKTNTANLSQSGLWSPQYMALDQVHNRLFVSDASNNNRVLVFDVSAITDGENAVNVLGQTDFVSNIYNITASNFDTPQGLVYDSINDRLFIADTYNHRVLVFDTTTITNGENAVNVLGSSDFISSDFGNTTQNTFNEPYGLAYNETTQTLFVSDATNNRVMVFDVSAITDGENAVNVLGQTDFVTSNSNISQSGFDYPGELDFNSRTNTLFVVDSGNYRIMTFDVSAINDNENATSVIGAEDFTTRSSGKTQSKFNDVYGLGLDKTNNRIYVPDAGNIGILNFPETSNNRVLVFDMINTPETADFANGTTSEAYSQALTTGSQGTVTHNLDSGTLPPGLSISGNTLSGTPTTAGTYNFTLTSTDTVSSGVIVFKDTQTYSVTIATGSGGGGGGGGGNGSGGDSNSSSSSRNTKGGNSPLTQISNVLNIIGQQIKIPKANTKPTITLIGASTMNLAYGQQFIDPSATALDAEGGDLTNRIVTTGTVNSFVPGTYKITYSVTDSSNKIASVSRTVQVRENAKPTLTLIGSPTITLALGTSFLDPGVKSSDPEDGDLTNKVTTVGTVNTSVPGTYKITYTITDSLKLSTSIKRTVLVIKEFPTSTPIESPLRDIPDIPQPEPSVEKYSAAGETNRGVRGAFRDITHSLGNFLAVNISQIANTENTASLQNLSINIAAALTMISMIGIFAGGIATPLLRLFNDSSFYSTLNLRRSWFSFLSVTGLRKRAKPWGTVYDSETKQPIDPAIVVLKDLSGKEISSAITDLDGRFGFLVPPGEYVMEVSKTNYLFPSQKLQNRDHDVLYENLYFGNPISITPDKVIIDHDVPMDRKVFDWNQFQKLERKDMQFFSRHEVLIARLSDSLFFVGFFLSLSTLFVTLTTLTVCIFIAQILILVSRLLGKPQKYGTVKEQTSGAPLQFALIRAINSDVNQEIRHTVTDEHGRYYCLVAPGNYSLNIEERNSDGTYNKIYSVGPFYSKTGLIDKHLKIKR